MLPMAIACCVRYSETPVDAQPGLDRGITGERAGGEGGREGWGEGRTQGREGVVRQVGVLYTFVWLVIFIY